MHSFLSEIDVLFHKCCYYLISISIFLRRSNPILAWNENILEFEFKRKFESKNKKYMNLTKRDLFGTNFCYNENVTHTRKPACAE